MYIKILGGRCRYCQVLKDRTSQAIEETGVEARVERVTNPKEICSYGRLAVPVLIIDEQIVCQGKVPTVDTLKDLILRRN